MNTPNDLKYTASHEWVRREADGTVTVGITDHAQEALGDLVFIELPAVGRTLAAGEKSAVVGSVEDAVATYKPGGAASMSAQHGGLLSSASLETCTSRYTLGHL